MTLLKMIINNYINKLLNNIVRYLRNRRQNLRGSFDNIKAEVKREFVNSLMYNYELRYPRGMLGNTFTVINKISQELVSALLSLGFRVAIIDARLETPGLVGVSQGVLKAVFEVGMMWDYVIDLPMIPASSIKGAVRAVIEQILHARCSRESCKECFECVDVLFGAGGHEGWAGLLLFFDAYPVDVRNSDGRLLEPDIISPHYMHSTEVVRFERLVEPIPVPHISIAPGTVFRFIVAAEPGSEVEESLKALMKCFNRRYTNLGVAISSLLLTAFRYGIGARTSRGYGKFEITRMSITVNENQLLTPTLFEPTVKRMSRKAGGERR